MYQKLKPMLNAEEQITHLKNKGVKFELMSEVDAENYLKANSNYFKLTAYRKNFQKIDSGPNEGKYVGLDFKLLTDMAIIDMRLRKVLLEIVIDLEYYIKIKILNSIENSTKDGYIEVEDYINYLKNTGTYSYLETELNRNLQSTYCGELAQKYFGNYPVWVFIEIIPFGSLINFYMFLANRFADKTMVEEAYLLKNVRELRNACAHNNCILNDLNLKTARHPTNYKILRELSNTGFTQTTTSRRMSNARIQQVVTLLFLAKNVITSSGIYDHHCERLQELKKRVEHHIDYYDKNLLIKGNFEFLNKIIDEWYTKSV